MNIRLITNREPEILALFRFGLKDGSSFIAPAVFERLELVKVAYTYIDTRYLNVDDSEAIIYDGSECALDPVSGENVFAYEFNVDIDDPCKIKKYAKLVIMYKDGTRDEVCGKYSGITMFQVLYRSCVDIDPDKLESVRLVPMNFNMLEILDKA